MENLQVNFGKLIFNNWQIFFFCHFHFLQTIQTILNNYTTRQNIMANYKITLKKKKYIIHWTSHVEIDRLGVPWFQIIIQPGWTSLASEFVPRNISFLSLFLMSKRKISRLFVASCCIGGGNRSTQKNHRPVASHWQTLSHNASSTPRHERDSNSLN